MTFKKSIKKFLTNAKERKEILYASSKMMFLIMMFLFFSAYFSISSGFYGAYFVNLFLPLYVGFLLSYILFLCAATHKIGASKVPAIVLWAVCALWCLLGAAFLLPIL